MTGLSQRSPRLRLVDERGPRRSAGISRRLGEEEESMHRVVVLGAGYAGLPAVNRIARQTYRDEVEVVLVNDRDTFVERPRLHQRATGQPLRERPLPAYLRPGVRLRVARAERVDVAQRTVRLRAEVGSDALGYDTLLWATGSRPDVDAVPGVREHASSLSDPATAAELARRLTERPDARVVVCGGGLTGLETAAEVAERFPASRVGLVTDGRVAGWLAPVAAAYVARSLEALGVAVAEHTRVVRVAPGALLCDDGAERPFDVCVWAGGFSVPPLAAEAGLTVDARGRIVTSPTLESVSHPGIYAAGDAAAVPGPWGTALAMGCRTGGFTGPRVADNIVARLGGREEKAFTFRYLHECVSLGRRRAVVQFLAADGSASRRSLRGRVAGVYKDVVLDGARLVLAHPGPVLPRRRHVVPQASGLRAA